MQQQRRALLSAAAAAAPQHESVGRHLATINEMRVSGSRQLRVAVLVNFVARNGISCRLRGSVLLYAVTMPRF